MRWMAFARLRRVRGSRVPGDDFGGRYVSNLVSLEVIDAVPVPEPASAALLTAALLALAALRRMRPIERR
jgi:hypothetical protein